MYVSVSPGGKLLFNFYLTVRRKQNKREPNRLKFIPEQELEISWHE